MAKVKDCPGFETFGTDVKEARKAKNLARKAFSCLYAQLHFTTRAKNFFEAGLSSENSKKRPASRNGPTGRRSVL